VSGIRELVAIAAGKALWAFSREAQSVGDQRAPDGSPMKGKPHYHRWHGNVNNIQAAWLFTFQSPLPLTPSVEIDYEGRHLHVYLDTKAITRDDVLGSIRLACYSPGGEVAIRSLDLSRVRAGKARAEASDAVERILESMGVMLDRVAGPPASSSAFADALRRKG
jgi:hypothetical protein